MLIGWCGGWIQSASLLLSGFKLPNGTASDGLVSMHFASGKIHSQGLIVIPNSNITIANNTFTSQTKCDRLGVDTAFVTVIAFIDTVPIVLGEGATISAQYNDITTNSGTTQHSVPFVANSITFNKGPYASIRGNYVRTHGKAGGGHTWAILFDADSAYVVGNTGGSTFRFLGGGGAWLFEENMIHITTENTFPTMLGNSPYIASPEGGVYNISRNYVKASPLANTSDAENALLDSAIIANAISFRFLLDGNTFDAYGRHSVIIPPAAVLNGESLLSIINNNFTSNALLLSLSFGVVWRCACRGARGSRCGLRVWGSVMRVLKLCGKARMLGW